MRLDYTFAELIAERDALRAALEGVIKDATLATDDAAIYEVSYLFINRAREALLTGSTGGSGNLCAHLRLNLRGSLATSCW